MSISNYAENKLLDAVFSHTTTGGGLPTADVYVSLHTADADETGSSECTGGSYARQQAAFNAASGGATANTAVITFAGMPACVVHSIGVWDALTVGNCLWTGNATVEKTVNAGDTYQIGAGDLDVTLD